MKPALLFLVTAFAGALIAGCGNPIQDARISALGPEDPAVPQSDIHRPGQPCLLCHGPYKGTSPEMVVAGTIYGYAYDVKNKEAEPIPVEGVRIELHDAYGGTPVDETGKKIEVLTNCAGNFYVTKDQWNAGFPLSVAIYCPDGTEAGQRVPMTTRISRDGSCAGCHDGNPNFTTIPDETPGPNQGTPGWVYCAQPGAGAPKYTMPDGCSPTLQ